jgi:branched-chain amino acid transport system substrate-binding protein
MTAQAPAAPTEAESNEARARRDVEAVNRECGTNPVRIGVLTPLTGPGDPVAGEIITRGARLGAEYVREHGGVLGGRDVELLLVNDQRTAAEESMAASAVQGLKELEQQGVVAVLGQWHLRTSGAVATAAEELGVPIFIENGDSDATRGRRTVFRTYFSIANRVPVMLDFLASIGLRRLALLAADTVFGLTTANELERYGGAEHGMEFLRFDFPQETVTDIRAELQQVVEWKPDAVVNDGVVRTNYLFLQQATEVGLRPSVPMMVTFGFPMRSADYWRLAGPAGNGITWPATQYRPSWSGLTEIGRWCTERYGERYGDFPPDTVMSAFTDVTLVAQALEAASSDARDDLIDALESREYTTWRGPVRFERGAEHWHHDVPELVVWQYQEAGQKFDDAAIVYPPARRTRPYLSPAELA